MVKVLTDDDGGFQIILTGRAHKVLKRAADEWSLSEGQHLENIITNFFESKIHEFENLDGPVMVRKYEKLSEKDQKAIDKLLTPESNNA